MPIARNAGADLGSFINEPGEYLVKVHETKEGLSKSGKRMLTVTFQTRDERTIKAYFVASLIFHMKALSALKAAAGLPPDARANQLIGREVGILVEPQKPNEEGKIFMHVTGYGKASEVSGSDNFGDTDFGGAPPDSDGVPF